MVCLLSPLIVLSICCCSDTSELDCFAFPSSTPVSCSCNPDPLLPPSIARWPSKQAHLKSHLCRSCPLKPSYCCTTTPLLRMRIQEIRMVLSPVHIVHPVCEPIWDTQTLSFNDNHQHKIPPTLRTKFYSQ